MQVYEPCNFVSNLAYHKLLIDVCNRKSSGKVFKLPRKFIQVLGQAIPTLTVGSCFYHGSNTKLGMQQDFYSIRIVIYLLHQVCFAGLKTKSSILTDFSPTNRKMSSEEMAETLQRMYASEPVQDWYSITNSLDVPDFRTSLGGLIITILSFNLDAGTTSFIFSSLASSFSLPSETITFIRQSYIHEIHRLVGNIDITQEERNSFQKKGFGIILKLFQAVLWRERGIFNTTLIRSPVTNYLGQYLNNHVSTKLNKLTGGSQHPESDQSSSGVYPGELACGVRYPHPKWHVLSSELVLDLLNIVDDVYMILKTSV